LALKLQLRPTFDKIEIPPEKNFVSRWLACVENQKPQFLKEPGSSWGAKLYIRKYRVLLSETQPNSSENAIFQL
jgi:hypothetical protein